jgi:hypothetical protein
LTAEKAGWSGVGGRGQLLRSNSSPHGINGVPILQCSNCSNQVDAITTIHNIKFFLCTGYGDSINYAGGESDNLEDPVKPQRMCQGNGAAPTAWTVTSIPMITAHRRKGHGAHFIAPILDITGHIVGGLFVDVTDLIHLDMQVMESIVEVHARLQESVINWGPLLIATGGALKPSKCLYYIISFRWKADGTWVYDLVTATSRVLCGIQKMDHMHLAKIHMGESG